MAVAAQTERRSGGAIWNWPLQVKVAVGFGIVALLLVLNSIAFFVAQERQGEARDWTTHTYEVLARLQNLQLDALDQQTALRGYLLTSDPEMIRSYDDAEQTFAKTMADLRELTSDNPTQQARLNRIGDGMERWRAEVARPVLKIIADTGSQASARPLIVKGGEYFGLLRDVIAETRSAERNLLDQRSARLATIVTVVRLLTIALLVIGVLVSLYAIRKTHALVTAPVVEMTELMTRLVAHDHSIEVPNLRRGDEIGAIARALHAFKQMAIETRTQNWIETSVAEISSRLQQATERQRFADEAALSTAKLLDCGLAIFYECGEHGETMAIGGYGQGQAALGTLRFSAGEGLVGQCLLQGKPLVIDGLPEHYVKIQSGLGAAPPQSLLLLPLLVRGRAVGLLELGSFQGFETAQRRLLDQLAPIAALSFDNLLRALRTQQLLEETQSQSEELQASEETLRVQQEELRATNDALHAKTGLLEQQAAKLRVSEEELKLQTEELRVSNEELSEKGSTLQEQKLILEMLQRDTQSKADELARASQYKSEFLANMSHELRTPLNSLLILSRSLADNEEQHLDKDEVESAEVIHDSGSKLLQLINDILDLSKVEAGKMDVLTEELSLSSFASSIQRNFRHVAAGRSLSFEIEIMPGTPAVIETDAARLEQIANNLLGNAFKFTQSGGVRLRISRPTADQPLPPGLDAARSVAIAIIDTGIGIPPEKMHKMFQAFEQVDAGTSRHYGGTGLGLSIARGMARLLGGDILMTSELGAGSVFTVLLPERAEQRMAETLPVAAGAQAASEPNRQPPSFKPLPAASIADDRELIRSGDTVILIIEDDPAFARILAELIRRKGYRVLAAGDGETGLALARQHMPSGVLLDVMLPGMDGWAVIDRMKADASMKTIPVHFISATEDVERGFEAGAIGFLTKPVSKNMLLQAFDRLLQHAPDTSTRRVLLVDDDSASRHAMRSLLAEAGVELVDADSGEEALKRLAEAPFDCIVLDLGLPGMSGYEFLERASQTGPLPPVVIHSGRELSREESLRLRQYTDSIVIKGVRSPERLLDEVSLFLHSIRPAVAPPPRELDSGLSGRTVLIVDDDMRNIFALSKALRAKGLKVLMAQDGHKALKQLQDNQGIEVVLMDIMMPGIDGYDTTREIRKQPQHRGLPIIALTAKAMRGDREKCLDAGANDYLSKPIDVDKLLSMMRVWVKPRA